MNLLYDDGRIFITQSDDGGLTIDIHEIETCRSTKIKDRSDGERLGFFVRELTITRRKRASEDIRRGDVSIRLFSREKQGKKALAFKGI